MLLLQALTPQSIATIADRSDTVIPSTGYRPGPPAVASIPPTVCGLHQFIVSFRATPRGMDRSWIRFAPSRAAAVESALVAIREEFGGKGRLLACDRVTMAAPVRK